MLRYLAGWLTEYYSGFNVFSYLTLRAILAALTALLISFLIGPVMIRKLAEHQVGQRVRSDGPQTHLTKAGTPTMGGALILVAIATLFGIVVALGAGAGMPPMMAFDPDPGRWAVAVLAVFATAYVGSLFSLRSILKTDPATALGRSAEA